MPLSPRKGATAFLAAAVVILGYVILRQRQQVADAAANDGEALPNFDIWSSLTDAAVSTIPTRGFRNYNPGNLEVGSGQWQGLADTTDGPYLIFVDMEHGLRALAINLINQQRKYHLMTIRGIITKYAPPSENDTAAYIDAVSNDTGLDPDASFDFNDSQDVFVAFIGSIIKHENGVNPFSNATLAVAAQEAYAH